MKAADTEAGFDRSFVDGLRLPLAETAASPLEILIQPRLALESVPGGKLSPRLIDLLALVDSTGSLNAACRWQNLSYRHAWKLIRQGEQACGLALLTMGPGRKSRLSDVARKLVQAMQRMQLRLAGTLEELQVQVQRELAASMQKAATPLRLHMAHDRCTASLLEALGREGLEVWHRDVPAPAAIASLHEQKCDVAGVRITGAADLDALLASLDDGAAASAYALVELAASGQAPASSGHDRCVLVFRREAVSRVPGSDVLRVVQQPPFHAGEVMGVNEWRTGSGGARGDEARPGRAAEATDGPPSMTDRDLRGMLSRRSVSPKRLGAPAPGPQEIDLMLQAALRAPDHGALRPWRVIEFRQAEREALAELFIDEKRRRDVLASPADLRRAGEHATRAPALLAFVVAPRPKSPVPLREQWLCAGAALGNLLQAAHQLGFGAIVLSGERCFDSELLRQLNIGSTEFLAGFISLGSIVQPPAPAKDVLTTQVWSCWMPRGD